ncbi:hypothetical protein [Streptomyces sp. HNA39]|uniref:hypothetical protein n=1 Tax=Streptomyces sp. HNA39 TaxID=2850561 RepID=UPI00200EDE8A|nr:hypothetical protein [Streptomyces sp. HNA39]
MPFDGGQQLAQGRVERARLVLGEQPEERVLVGGVLGDGGVDEGEPLGREADPQAAAVLGIGTPTDETARLQAGEASCRVDTVKRVTLTGSDRLLRPVIAAVITRTERGDLRRVKHLLERSWKSR